MKKNQLTTTKSTSLALGKTKSLIGITAKILKPKRKDLVIHEDITIIGDLVWEKEIPKDQMTWDEAMTYAKNLKQGGYNDWRLATVDELLEIGREGKIPIREDSNSEKSISYGYWTSTISAIKVVYDHTDIGFIMKKGSNGMVDEFCFEGDRFLEDVALIRKNGKLILEKTEKNLVLPSNDDTIIIGDLMWEKETHEKMSWIGAVIYAKKLRHDSYDDWRLPTSEELLNVVTLCGGIAVRCDNNKLIGITNQNIANKNMANEAYQANYKEKGFTLNKYWSSIQYDNIYDAAWYIDFETGHEISFFAMDDCYFRCVRTIQ